MPKLISDLALLLLTAGAVAVVFRRFEQPLVLGFRTMAEKLLASSLSEAE